MSMKGKLKPSAHSEFVKLFSASMTLHESPGAGLLELINKWPSISPGS
jgi:hypothetical protein